MAKDVQIALDKTSHLPLFAQIKQILEGEIRAGHYGPGQPLPSEAELADRFGVSRMTLRQAMLELVYDGVLERARGRGTFVRHHQLYKRLISSPNIIGLYDSIAAQGKELVTQVRGVKVVPAPAPVAHHLEVAPGTPVVHLERLRFVDDIPLTLQTSYLPHSLVPGLESEDLSRGSLVQLLERRYGYRLVFARQVISAQNASLTDARLLAVKPGAALLHMEKLSCTTGRRPIEFVSMLLPPDRYQFHIEHQPNRPG